MAKLLIAYGLACVVLSTTIYKQIMSDALDEVLEKNPDFNTLRTVVAYLMMLVALPLVALYCTLKD